jgi:hypothetical protein
MHLLGAREAVCQLHLENKKSNNKIAVPNLKKLKIQQQ